MKRLCYILAFGFLAVSALGQSIDTDFGKNRVQYHDDFDTWYIYESDNFLTYYYGKSRNVAEPAVQIAEEVHDEIQNIIEHRINDKINIIVYTDVSDVKQSNIGLDETFTSRPGETKIIGNKMFVYFDGNHQNLRRQIREGIASVYLSAMQVGDGIQERIQNAVLLNLPEWYKRGIISYIGSYWDAAYDDELRDILAQDKRYYSFKKLSEHYPEIAGHSFWYFIDQYYGKSIISNILYLTRITKNVDEALLYVLNEDLKSLSAGWEDFYKDQYRGEPKKWNEKTGNELSLKKKKYAPTSLLRYSPDGKYLAYVENNIGKTKVRIKDVTAGEEWTLFRYGHKNNLQATDYDYPLIAWSPNGTELTVIYEHRDVIMLRRYDITSRKYREQIIPTALQRIYSVDYVTDDKYVFAASTDGYSDVYFYNFTGRQYERLSNDFYDDLDVNVIELVGSKGLLFSSNRMHNHIFKMSYDTIIPAGMYDLFFYDLETNDGSLLRLTNTPDIDERYPFAIGNKIIHLADKSGMKNTQVYDVSTNTTYAVSDYGRNAIRHHGVADVYAKMHYHLGTYDVVQDSMNWTAKGHPTKTNYYKQEYAKGEVFVPFKAPAEVKEIPENLMFQTTFGEPKSKKKEALNDEKNETSLASDRKKVHDFRPEDARVARLAFRIDKFTTKMDNEVLFEGLESYTGNRDQLLTSPFGFLIKTDVTDLFEDYWITAGARIPTSLNGSEYFITFDDNKRLWDKRYALYRKLATETVDDSTNPATKAQKTTMLGMVQFKYPFNIFRSVRLTGSLRFDKFYYQSTNTATFEAPVQNEKRISVKAEYIYDNTIDVAVNIKHGTRYKIYAEAINEFNIQFQDGFEADFSRGFTGVFGFDARHYIPVLEHIVFAIRGAGGTSLGSKKNLYYIGGVNNALTNLFNTETPIFTDGSYAYKTNVFHLRGFKPNIRNGSSFLVLNSELRVPLFRYLMGRYGGSNFWRNFQLVGFFDAGTAWYGLTPQSNENPLNYETVEAGDIVQLNVKYYRDPLVFGYGVGVRCSFLGYFLRLDMARGIETRTILKPRWHFSVGMDF